MSAAELRQAAEVERREWGGEQNARQFPTSSAIHLALADWLEHSARQLAELEPSDSHPGLIVARLINGDAS